MFQNYIVSQNFNASDSDVFFLLIIINFHPPKKRNKNGQIRVPNNFSGAEKFCRSRPWELHQSGRGHTSRALNTDAGPNRRGRGDSRGEVFGGEDIMGGFATKGYGFSYLFIMNFGGFKRKKTRTCWWIFMN